MLLEDQGMRIVGVASTAAEGVERAREAQPDVVLVDVDLGEDSGFVLATQLVDGDGERAHDVILISTHPEDEFADLIAQSPARGYIAKSDLSAAAIRRLLDAPSARRGT